MRGGERRFAFQLAHELGYVDVDAMWDSIPKALQEEWKVYFELEPNLIERMDWNFAHVVQVMARSPKHFKEFVLPFGDRPSMRLVQSLETQEMLLDAWIGNNNAIQRRKTHNG